MPSNEASHSEAASEVSVLDETLSVTTWATDFVGPTQMAMTPSGHVLVGELNGAENDGTGRIIQLAPDSADPDTADPDSADPDSADSADPDSADPDSDRRGADDRVVLQTGLDKPTGIAVIDDSLWIMERDQLSVTSLTPGAPRTVVLSDLPNNGRSQGTLTVTPDGALLFATSGRRQGPDPVDGSGTIYRLEDPAAAAEAARASSPTANGVLTEPTIVATGFKNAYAHVFDADERLWSVEMSDGTFDGDRAPDELLQVRQGDNAGWPQCIGDNTPVIEFDGTPEVCASAPRSHALFQPGATPTSVIVSPFDENELWLTLWIPGHVVAVPLNAAPSPHEPETIITDIESPQHLLAFATAEGAPSVLLADHETGTIFRITKTAP